MTDWRKHPRWPGFVSGHGLVLYRGEPLTLRGSPSEVERALERMAPDLTVGPLPTTELPSYWTATLDGIE